jgi:hypothetical protein
MRMIAIAALAAGLSGAAYGQALVEGYTCCNLHYEADWISDGNWSGSPIIPAGARIRVVSFGWWNNRAFVEIDGTPFRLGHDYGRAEEPLDKFVSKWIVAENPRNKIALYPEHVKTAIFNGKVIEGMTREQVLIAVGYPPTHQTRTLDSPLWNHWLNRMSRYEVHWSQEGTVQKVVGRQ